MVADDCKARCRAAIAAGSPTHHRQAVDLQQGAGQSLLPAGDQQQQGCDCQKEPRHSSQRLRHKPLQNATGRAEKSGKCMGSFLLSTHSGHERRHLHAPVKSLAAGLPPS